GGDYDEAHDFDLVLRCLELTTGECIRHIPRVLYHARGGAGSAATDEMPCALPPTWAMGAKAIKEHLARRRIGGTVRQAGLRFFQVEYELAAPPKVSIIIPTTLKMDVLKRCTAALLGRTSYPDVEILFVVNNRNPKNRQDQETLLDVLRQDRRVRL